MCSSKWGDNFFGFRFFGGLGVVFGGLRDLKICISCGGLVLSVQRGETWLNQSLETKVPRRFLGGHGKAS